MHLAANLLSRRVQERGYRRRPFWIDLTVLRNYTLHTYNEDLADYVYSRLSETVTRFRALLNATT
jgi:hypothetical protein